MVYQGLAKTLERKIVNIQDRNNEPTYTFFLLPQTFSCNAALCDCVISLLARVCLICKCFLVALVFISTFKDVKQFKFGLLANISGLAH